MSFNLDGGAILRMLNNDTSLQPTLQVLDVKRVVTGSSGERYRVVLSDGTHYIQGMLASQCTNLVNATGPQQLKRWSVINLKEYVCNHISGKKICVVINCNVIGHCEKGIGSPQNAQGVSAPAAPANNNNNAQSRNNTNNNRSNYQKPPAPPQNQGSFNQRNNHQNFNRRPASNSGNNSSSSQAQPVSSLNPYQNNWTIKVRCTNRDNMRHYHNQKGDGKLFSVDLLDKDGTEIRAVMFNDAAEKFFPIFEKNNVYLISKGSVRLAKKGFSHIQNDYQITLNADADVNLVNDEEHSIQTMKYNFKPIKTIELMEAKQFVDVIGICVDIGPTSIIKSKQTNQDLTKRTLKIADETAKIEVTLWNDMAKEYDEDKLGENAVIALKGAKVSHFGGRSLSASGFIEINPNHLQQTSKLQNWFRSTDGNVAVSDMTTGGSGGVIAANSPRITFGEAKQMRIGEETSSYGNGDKNKDFFNVVATITSIAQSNEKRPWYLACPAKEGNNAKVTAQGNGSFFCEKTGKTYNSYNPRYILRFCATDCTGNVWLTAFNEVAELILENITAKEAETMCNDGREKEYQEIFKKAQFGKYVFRVRASPDSWEDQVRIRYTAVKAQLVDPIQETNNLLQKITLLKSVQ